MALPRNRVFDHQSITETDQAKCNLKKEKQPNISSEKNRVLTLKALLKSDMSLTFRDTIKKKLKA